jgi:hypothetical protein
MWQMAKNNCCDDGKSHTSSQHTQQDANPYIKMANIFAENLGVCILLSVLDQVQGFPSNALHVSVVRPSSGGNICTSEINVTDVYISIEDGRTTETCSG